MDEVFRVTDRWGRVIVLTQDRWLFHILPKHPELTASAAVVAVTVREPILVNHDRSRSDREGFYRPSSLPDPWSNLLVRMVVGFGVTAQVVTAHLIKEPHREEQRKWP